LSKLQILSAKEVEYLLFSLGFQKIRQKGSHVFYKHSDGRTTTVPHHPGRDLSRPLLRSILRDVRLSLQDFKNLLEKI
jgi:predicted RNA binding protein YcfA (HicA-like mRNA interferase family)